MHKFLLLQLFAASILFAAPGNSAKQKPEELEKVTVRQLEQIVDAARGESDAAMAQQISGLELRERLGSARLAHLMTSTSGEKAHQALMILADQSEFLAPPGDEVVDDPTPDAAATRRMLVQVVNYVNNTLRQLPNLIATRNTRGFEDRPQEDRLEATGIVSYSHMPLHLMGRSSVIVTYRDRKEVVDAGATKSLRQRAFVGGLITSGEFGPTLSIALGDALKGKITWARWERGASKPLAVFQYSVSEEKSNYRVKFCCMTNGIRADGTLDMQPFNEKSGYHGEIVFDSVDGSILRLTIESEMPVHGLVPSAGIAIEYGPVEIGGKTYICPVRSVSRLLAHTTAQKSASSRSNFEGPTQTFLNDVEFRQFRRFGSEVRILTDDITPTAR